MKRDALLRSIYANEVSLKAQVESLVAQRVALRAHIDDLEKRV
jgi:cell division protein FtsB